MPEPLPLLTLPDADAVVGDDVKVELGFGEVVVPEEDVAGFCGAVVVEEIVTEV